MVQNSRKIVLQPVQENRDNEVTRTPLSVVKFLELVSEHFLKLK
jgi:hypothetical protein